MNVRYDYDSLRCRNCGHVIKTLPSRLAWVLRMHRGRCDAATEEERREFRATGRWSRKRSAPALCLCIEDDCPRPHGTGPGVAGWVPVAEFDGGGNDKDEGTR